MSESVILGTALNNQKNGCEARVLIKGLCTIAGSQENQIIGEGEKR